MGYIFELKSFKYDWARSFRHLKVKTSEHDFSGDGEVIDLTSISVRDLKL